MFILLAALAGLYAVNAIQLLVAGDPGGALVVGTMAVAFVVFSRRSWHKRKEGRMKKRYPALKNGQFTSDKEVKAP